MDKKNGKKKTHNKHIELGTKRMIKDESEVQLIIDTLNSWVPELYSEDQPLIKICNGKTASPELIKNVSTTYSRGVTERDIFISRLVTFKNNPSDGKLTYHDKMNKQDVITFQFKKMRKKTKTIAADEGEPFAEILFCYDGKILDHEFLVRWLITTAPWMICNEEEMSRCE